MNWWSNLVLANPALLPLTLLVAAPLVLHLFARAQPPVYRFSSIAFIERIVRRSVRLRRPQSWLVLLLRTVLFAALIGAFLQPVWFGSGRAASYLQRKHVVVLVDASASMAAMQGSQTRFATACAKASEVLAGLSAADAANVIWLRTPSRAEFPTLGVNIPFLQTALRKATVSLEAADLRGGFDLATSLLQDTTVAREIYVISDFQRSSWSGLRPDVSSAIRLVTIRIGNEDLPNQALTRLYARPASVLANEEFAVYCEVENFSPQPTLKTVSLRAGELRQEQEVRLAPWQKAVAVFRCRLSGSGENVLTASLSEDAFPFDNERWAIVDVRDSFHVGLFNKEPLTAAYWRKALEAVGWAKLETLTSAQLNDKLNFNALLLSGWDGNGGAGIADYLHAGGTVVWFPSDRTRCADIQAVAGLSKTSAATLVWQPSKQAWRLKLARLDDPVFEVFAGGAHGDPTRGVLFARYSFPAADFAGADPILAYHDDVPALLHIKCGGHLFLWNIPLQPEHGNWASQSEFLPFFIELLLKHRSAGQPAAPRDSLPGQAMMRRLDHEVLSKDISLLTGQNAVPLQRQADPQHAIFAALDTTRLGVYRWQYRGQPLGCNLVNFPTVESDLRFQVPDTLTQTASIALEAGQAVRDLREGVSLWPLLLLVAIGAAMAEAMVLRKAAA